MIQIGNFFFKYRNWVFIPLYLALFIPSTEIVSSEQHYLTLWLGLFITILGQMIRWATVGFDYIDRGGKDKKVYASRLVTGGIFNHCRNPLYIGNILKLAGLGILTNSLLYIIIFVPAFMFIYQAIVLAEENYLRTKFGQDFDVYCQQVNRWIPSFSGLITTFNNMSFRWQRPVVKENSSVFIWSLGILLILLFKYPELTHQDTQLRSQLLVVFIPLLTALYFGIRYLKKSNKLQGL